MSMQTKYSTKKNVLRFAEIVEAIKDNEVEINSLVKYNGKNWFSFPVKEDLKLYSYLICPPSNPVDTIYRYARKLVFSYDLFNYKDLSKKHQDYQTSILSITCNSTVQ